MDLSERIAGLLAAYAPEAIERESLRIIDEEVPEPRLFAGARLFYSQASITMGRMMGRRRVASKIKRPKVSRITVLIVDQSVT